MIVDVKMFGAFRALGDALSLNLADTATTEDMASALAAHLDDHPALLALLPVTRFSTETDILTSDTVILPGVTYAVLPPVSGG